MIRLINHSNNRICFSPQDNKERPGDKISRPSFMIKLNIKSLWFVLFSIGIIRSAAQNDFLAGRHRTAIYKSLLKTSTVFALSWTLIKSMKNVSLLLSCLSHDVLLLFLV
jgi:hypothetical protein